jgi:hypothetical protein
MHRNFVEPPAASIIATKPPPRQLQLYNSPAGAEYSRSLRTHLFYLTKKTTYLTKISYLLDKKNFSHLIYMLREKCERGKSANKPHLHSSNLRQSWPIKIIFVPENSLHSRESSDTKFIIFDKDRILKTKFHHKNFYPYQNFIKYDKFCIRRFPRV